MLLERLASPSTRNAACSLSVANQQMVEIAKAVSYNSEILIMDEPTSAITEKEVDHLFEIINQLRAEGKSILYITHKMNEVFTIADDITVFRDGKYVGTDRAANLDQNKLIAMMVGRELTRCSPGRGGDRRGGARRPRPRSRACSGTCRSRCGAARSWAWPA